MRIVNQPLEAIKFGNVLEGQVFSYEDNCYMKIEDVGDITSLNNCVDLIDGTCHYLFDEITVVLVDAKLIVR